MPVSLKRLSKKAKHGFRGYPMATIAYYGPTDRLASKVAVAVMFDDLHEPTCVRRWLSDDRDVRHDPNTLTAVLAFIKEWDVKTVVMPDAIIGCPHEEGIDYEGSVCPKCPFWAGRDRWRGIKGKG